MYMYHKEQDHSYNGENAQHNQYKKLSWKLSFFVFEH